MDLRSHLEERRGRLPRDGLSPNVTVSMKQCRNNALSLDGAIFETDYARGCERCGASWATF